ncbi:MAG: thrombospondin type 3 repeat-containing protein [Gammaproteobacteria bacterium]
MPLSFARAACLSAGLLLSGGVLPVASAEDGAAVTASATQAVEGVFTARWGDPSDGTNVRYAFQLTTSSGKVFALDIPTALLRTAGGIEALNGERVVATLNLSSSRTVADVQSLELVSATRGVSRMIEGSRPWITVTCKFNDVSAEPRSLGYFQSMYDNTPGRLDDYWREVSYNNIDIVGSTALDWEDLPGPQSSYVPSPGSGTSADLDQLFIDCINEVDDFVDFSLGGTDGYEGINLMFNDRLDCCAWGGGRFATIDGVSKVWRTTWNPPFSYTNVAVIAHEMGHGFGLPHANNSDGDSSPYDSPWDVMSAATSYTVDDPVYGALGKHVNSYHKDRLGWIAGSERFVASDDAVATITIDPLGSATTDTYRMARIPISGSRYYTVEVREAVGQYEADLPGNGGGDRVVIIHNVDPSRREPAWVIDSNTPVATFSDTEGVMWRSGETFNDAANSITVTVGALTATGFEVQILTGDPQPDTDGDGIADNADNCSDVSNADQRDTNGDGFGNLCDADLNNDGVINVTDLGLLRAVFFTADEDADLDGDGTVNVVDLGLLRQSFFGAPGPSGIAN